MSEKKISPINTTLTTVIDNIVDKSNNAQRKNNGQGILPLIEHKIDSGFIKQRANDGYINATALCKAGGKLFADYYRLTTTQTFLKELSSELKVEIESKQRSMGIPIDLSASVLIQVIQVGHNDLRGTWVHPQVAINLGQWASPKFAVLVSKWVFKWMHGGTENSYKFPYHIRRYLINRSKIPPTHFSMLDQITVKLLGALEAKGYVIPATIMPDISMGKIFSQWLKKKGHNPDSFPTYQHNFDDGRRPVVTARLYPNELMTDFNLELEEWIKTGKALKYFSTRDKDSIHAIKAVYTELPEN